MPAHPRQQESRPPVGPLGPAEAPQPGRTDTGQRTARQAPSITPWRLAPARALLSLLTTLAALGTEPARGQGDVAWTSGPALTVQLQSTVSLHWSNSPLREALQRFSKSQRIAVMLDRRVDPDQHVELRIDNQPLEEAFAQIAAYLGQGVTRLGPVVYLGPSEVTGRLQTLHAMRTEEIDRLPEPAQAALERRRPWSWPYLSTPRELLQRIAAESGVEIGGLDHIPHDLWPAAQLPPLSLTELLTLLGAGFDLTFQVHPNGHAVRLVPLENDTPQITRSYPVKNGLPSAQMLADLVPDADIEVQLGRVVVRGRLEDHQLITRQLQDGPAGRPGPAKPPDGRTRRPSQRRYTLTVENTPVGSLIRQLATQLNVTARFDEPAITAAEISLDTLVSLRVQDASAEQLLQAAAEPAGLRVTRVGSVFTVGPADAPSSRD